jgi:hypothetical protein
LVISYRDIHGTWHQISWDGKKRLRKKFPSSLEDQSLQGLPQAQTPDRIFSTLSTLQGMLG